MLTALAIAVGIVGVVKGLVGLVAPEFARKLLKTFLEKRVLALASMVVAAVVGSFFTWGFQIWTADHPARWNAWALLVFGAVLTAGGLFFLLVPRALLGIMARMFVARSATLRILGLLGVVLNAIVILIAVSLKVCVNR
jgi:uncharacterized protein YjeT (DUF2065 family)